MSIAKLSSTKFVVNLGFLSIESNWEVNDVQRNAAWEMYVELVTRISTSKLEPGEGILRESLSSLYSLFSITRAILKNYGPAIATTDTPGDITFGHLAVGILNKVLRPILSKWHPKLLDWEQIRPEGRSSFEHDQLWVENNDLRELLNSVRVNLIEYANVLGTVAGVDNLIEE